MVRWGKLEVEPKRPALSSIYNNKKSVPFLDNRSELSKMGQNNQYLSQWQQTHTHTNLGIKKKNSLGSGSLDFWWKMSPARNPSCFLPPSNEPSLRHQQRYFLCLEHLPSSSSLSSTHPPDLSQQSLSVGSRP